MLSEYSSTRHAGFRGIHEHVHPAALGSQFLHTQDTQLLSCPRQVLNFHTCKQQYLFLSIYTVFQETALWSVSYVLHEKCRNHSHNAGFQSGPSCTPPGHFQGLRPNTTHAMVNATYCSTLNIRHSRTSLNSKYQRRQILCCFRVMNPLKRSHLINKSVISDNKCHVIATR
jgi:hypothetical protein